MSTLTFWKIPPLLYMYNMYLILISTSCRRLFFTMYCCHWKIDKAKIYSWQWIKLYIQDFRHFFGIAFEKNVNVDIVGTTWVPSVDIRWHFHYHPLPPSCKGSFISKGFWVLAWKILISHFGNEVSALEWKFLLKFEFWRTFVGLRNAKSAPKFKFQKKFPLQGRNFVAKMGDENFQAKT